MQSQIRVPILILSWLSLVFFGTAYSINHVKVEQPIQHIAIAAVAPIQVAQPSPPVFALPKPVSVPPPAFASKFKSSIVEVFDELTNTPILAKNTSTVAPIASISKLMSAMVLLDMNPSLNDKIRISSQDIDTLKNSTTHLAVGQSFTRLDLLKLALMKSENPAIHALARTAPGGMDNFVARMNAKSAALSMTQSHFVEPSGLSPENVSTADNLARMVLAAEKYPLIQKIASSSSDKVGGVRIANTNSLMSDRKWHINLSKTGYINEAGRCVVMLSTFNARRVVVVLLNSGSKEARASDENHIQKLMSLKKFARL